MKYRVVIPSWLPLEVDMQAETGVKYPGFVQLNGQPLYSHIMRQYELLKDRVEFVLVLPDEAPSLNLEQLSDFKIQTLPLSKSNSIGETVYAAIADMGLDYSLVVHMADTLLQQDDCFCPDDTVYVDVRSDLYRWTSVQKRPNGALRILADRDHTSSGHEQFVCVGVFMLSDAQFFASILESSLAFPAEGIDPFFTAIETYSEKHPINLSKPSLWYDCGHIDSYYESRLRHQNLRHFNSLTYDSDRGLVTKRSENSDAFRHQVRWYKQVPDDLAWFLPRIFDSSDGLSPYITMELLSIPTLTDLFVNSRLELGAWNDVARKLQNIQSVMQQYTFSSPVAAKIMDQIYVRKTIDRLLDFCKQRSDALSISVVAQGDTFGLRDVLDTIEAYAAENCLLHLDSLSPIHGDLCFSNIMYDPRSRHIKLIDPRGEFGIPGIFGDPRYDKAKLMHSYYSGYDFIVSDQFDLKLSKDGILDCNIRKDDYHQKVKQIFDSELFIDEGDRSECESIQALLFLSMLPLHRDKPSRQLAMLHTGLNLYVSNLLKRGIL